MCYFSTMCATFLYTLPCSGLTKYHIVDSQDLFFTSQTLLSGFTLRDIPLFLSLFYDFRKSELIPGNSIIL